MPVLSNKHSGFTIVELAVVISVLGILIVVVLGTLASFYQSNVDSLTQTTKDTDTRGVLRSIEKELTNSNSFAASIAPVSPLGSKNDSTAWSFLGNDSSQPNNRVLIGTAYATDKAPTDDTRLPIFTDTSASPTCDPSSSTVAPAKNALIYFIAKDPQDSTVSNLYRRTIVNGVTGGTLCGTPYQKQTCASSSNSPTVCKAIDATLLRNAVSMTIDYYTSSNDVCPVVGTVTSSCSATQPYSTSVDPNLIINAKSIKLTVVTNERVNNVTSQNTASIRISRSY